MFKGRILKYFRYSLLPIFLLFLTFVGLGIFLFTEGEKADSKKEYANLLSNKLNTLVRVVDDNILFLEDEFDEVGENLYIKLYENGVEGNKLLLSIVRELNSFLAIANLNEANNTLEIRDAIAKYKKSLEELILLQEGNTEVSLSIVPLQREQANANQNLSLLVDKITLNPDEFVVQISKEIERIDNMMLEARDYMFKSSNFLEIYNSQVRVLEIELELLVGLRESAINRDSKKYDDAFKNYSRKLEEESVTAQKEYDKLDKKIKKVIREVRINEEKLKEMLENFVR